jgi:hypothetical protein
MNAIGGPYPATFTFDAPERIGNWRPLVQWLLAIPHLAVLYALGVVSDVLAVISWFAVLFTGRLPAGLAAIQAMYLRYTLRTATTSGSCARSIRRSALRRRTPIPATTRESASISSPSLRTATG